MSTNINPNVLKNFIVKTIGADLTAKDAQKLGVQKEYSAAVEGKDENVLDLNDVLQDQGLYEQFATMYNAEQDKKTEAKDKEQEKEDQKSVKNEKKNAGA